MIMVDWKHALEYIKDEDKIKRLNQILPKFKMATDYLHNHTNLLDLLKNSSKNNTTITYQDHCHSK